jgi:lipoprotein-releasing system permease protein
LNLPLFIAKRYLISKKSHNAINIISIIAVAGVCIATMATIIVMSAFNGLSDLVKSLYNSFDAEIQITPKQGKTFFSDAKELAELKKMKGVVFYNEVIEGNALLKYKEKQCIVTVKGVSSDFMRMSRLDTVIVDGEFNISKSNCVMGKGVYYLLDASVNDFSSPVSIYAPKRGKTNSINPEDGLNEIKTYPAGTFSINDEFDQNYIIVSLENAKKIFDYSNEITSVELGLSATANKQQLQEQIENLLGENYTVQNREQQNALLFKTMKSEKLWTFIILIFIIVIATFNVIGCISMLIIEKKKDIQTLYHLGADSTIIKKIFLNEGLMISLTGAIFGLLLGIFVCWIQLKFSIITFSEGYVVDAYPVKMELSDICLILFSVVAIGYTAAWYPIKNLTKDNTLAFERT